MAEKKRKMSEREILEKILKEVNFIADLMEYKGATEKFYEWRKVRARG